MSTGLLALLDDVVALAKVAAASLDDVAAQTIKVGAKSAGVVVDDAAVTPRYVLGFAADRELPIVAKIARGSIRNKLLFLLPAALLLSLFAPWLITPLLMLGGGFLCYEGAEKILVALMPGEAHTHEARIGLEVHDPATMEEQRISGAIRTDFILSAEIMAITLAGIPAASAFATRAAVLALVGVGITILVYGAVAIIVKADDAGLALSRTTARNLFGKLVRALGRGLVSAMPAFLRLLSTLGTVAMLWVGGSILLHGLEVLGLQQPAQWLHDLAVRVADSFPAFAGWLAWLVEAVGAIVAGVLAGALLIPLVQYVIVPLWKRVKPG